MSKQKGLEDILYSKGIINKDQLSAIKLEFLNTGKPVDEIILSRKYADIKQLALAKSLLYDIPFVDAKQIEIVPDVLDLLPESVARRYKLVPTRLDGVFLSVVMVDPLDLESIEFIERKTGYTVKPILGLEEDIEKVITSQYGKNIGKDVTEALEEVGTATKMEEQLKDLDKAEEIIRDAPVARIVGALLELGVKSHASDIHIEPTETSTLVRYRIDGVLREKVAPLPKSVHSSLVARIKILSGLKIDEKRKPQDGRFKVKFGESETDLRVSTLPTIIGEKVVIRLLKDEGVTLALSDLGLRGLALKRFEESLLKPHGIILVTGPTGSGKTVTLATALSKLNSKRVNIVTIEDPVEIKIKGVNHVQVNPQAGLTFAAALRSFLRQDPNIIMVGEIRDGETAELAIHASLVGRLVLSTLHTNSAAGAIPRFLDMGIENFLLSSTLVMVLAQRLVRKICPFCKEEYTAPPELEKSIRETLGDLLSNYLAKLDKTNKDTKTKKEAKGITLFRGKGCEKCSNEGYTGRVGIFEVMQITDKIARTILERKTDADIEKIAMEEGMITLAQDGFLKALEGLTTLEEVLMVARE